MKVLFMLQGAPGVGKSYLLEKMGVNDYTISRDKIRDMFSPSVMDIEGSPVRFSPTGLGKVIESTYMSILEHRLKMGSTIFLEGINDRKNQGAAVQLATEYQYKCYLVNMQGDATLDEVLAGNRERNAKNVLDDFVVEGIYQRVRNSKGNNHPSLEVLEPGFKNFEVAEKLIKQAMQKEAKSNDIDVAPYKNVIIFGDIHSMNSKLETAIKSHGGIDNKDNLYIFVGDLFDRGDDPVGVYNTVKEERDNVILLEGNHETNLKRLVIGSKPDKKYIQTRETLEQLLDYGVTEREIKKLLRMLKPYVRFTINGVPYFVTHGGVTNKVIEHHFEGIPGIKVSDREFIYGTSERSKAYHGSTTYSNIDNMLTGDYVNIHGHRNTKREAEPMPIAHTPGVYNLEQGVDAGGHLAAVVINVETGNVKEELY